MTHNPGIVNASADSDHIDRLLTTRKTFNTGDKTMNEQFNGTAAVETKAEKKKRREANRKEERAIEELLTSHCRSIVVDGVKHYQYDVEWSDQRIADEVTKLSLSDLPLPVSVNSVANIRSEDIGATRVPAEKKKALDKMGALEERVQHLQIQVNKLHLLLKRHRPDWFQDA